MSIILAFLGLLLIFYWMAKICDEYFVESLKIISDKLHISDNVAGATFMAIGSSAPELFTAIIALSKVGIESVGAGTIVGSAIFNILVIVGASAAIATAYLDWKPMTRDLGFYLASLFILLLTFSDGEITIEEAGIYLVLYALYIFVLIFWKKWVPHKPKKEAIIHEHKKEVLKQKIILFRVIDHISTKLFSMLLPNMDKKHCRYKLAFTLSVFYIAALSWGMVELGIFIAHGLNIPEAIIALTILAAGTSVPDLLSSIIASKKGYGDMAVSNAIGSNTFDILIGLGLPWFIYILLKGSSIHIGTENLWSSIVLLFGTVLLLVLILVGQKFRLNRAAGGFLIGIYICYLTGAVILSIKPDILHAMTNLII